MAGELYADASDKGQNCTGRMDAAQDQRVASWIIELARADEMLARDTVQGPLKAQTWPIRGPIPQGVTEYRAKTLQFSMFIRVHSIGPSSTDGTFKQTLHYIPDPE